VANKLDLLLLLGLVLQSLCLYELSNYHYNILPKVWELASGNKCLKCKSIRCPNQADLSNTPFKPIAPIGDVFSSFTRAFTSFVFL